MIEDRPGQHQTIEQCNGDAHRNSAAYVAQHAAGCGAVNVQHIIMPSITCRNHEWLAIKREPDMANESFVQYSVDDFAVVNCASVRGLHECAASALRNLTSRDLPAIAKNEDAAMLAGPHHSIRLRSSVMCAVWCFPCQA